MIKILHILNSVSYDGAAVLAFRTIKLTPQFNHNIVSVFPGNAENEFCENEIKSCTLLKTKPNGVVGAIKKNLSLMKFLKGNNYDIIHFQGGGISVLLFVVLFKKNLKAIFHLHSGNVTGIPFRLNIPISHKLIYKSLDTRVEKIATCEHVGKFYVGQINPARHESIHLIRNYSPFNFRVKEKLTRTIGYIGRIISEKGIQLFFEIIENEEFKKLNLKALLMGDCSKEIAELTRKKIDNEIVELLKPSLCVEEFYKKVDILIFPSLLTETLPLVLLEAASFDVAAVAFKTSATEEIFCDYPMLVNKADALLFIEKIKKYYSSDSLRMNLSKIHNDVTGKFNQEEYRYKMVELYSSLVSK